MRIGGKTYDRVTNAQTYKTFDELAAPVFSERPIDKGYEFTGAGAHVRLRFLERGVASPIMMDSLDNPNSWGELCRAAYLRIKDGEKVTIRRPEPKPPEPKPRVHVLPLNGAGVDLGGRKQLRRAAIFRDGVAIWDTLGCRAVFSAAETSKLTDILVQHREDLKTESMHSK